MLTGPQPADRGGVETLVALDQRHAADVGKNLGVEQRPPSAAGEGFPQPAEEPAAGLRPPAPVDFTVACSPPRLLIR